MCFTEGFTRRMYGGRLAGFAFRGLLLVLIDSIATATAQARPVQITGRVLTEGGPAATTITCTAVGEALLSLPEPVGLGGRYSLSMESGNASHVSCTTSAKGFKPGVVTGLIADGKAHLETLALVRSTTLSIEAVLKQSLASEGDATGVAVLLANHGASDVAVAELSVAATAHEQTTCFDPRPTLIFDFAPRLAFQMTSPSQGTAKGHFEWPQGNLRESVSATVKLEKMGCDQQRLLIRIPYPFNVPRDSSLWLRFVLPARIAAQGGTEGKAVDILLFGWEQIQADVRLADGTTLSKAGSR